jgi:repressor LexA
MDKISQKQEQILEYIKQVLREKGYPPAVREIAEAVGLKSPSTVHSHLSTLEEKGYIRKDPSKPRAIEVLDERSKWIQEKVTPVPVLGRVTAGVPILAAEQIETYFPLPAELTRYEDVYMLRVVGESMINAGIFDGDYIIVRQQTTAQNNDIVVALLGDEVTVKRFFKEPNRVRLQPENDTMSPIYVREVEILGKVIGLYREY